MSAAPQLETCARCGAELETSTLDGLCPACVARAVFGPDDAARAAAQPFVEQFVAGAFGEYELLGEIARGGMGVVYKARDRKLNRIVAVKVIRGGQLAGPIELERFRKEAEAAAHLQHPNIVMIHEVGEHDGLPYFTMEYVEGQTLAQLVRTGPLPARRAADYLKTIAHAIQFAHEAGVLHRDLKPSNVLIDQFDRPRVTDFGLAKRFDGDGKSAVARNQLTVTGEFVGTPSFASPEQAGARSGGAGAGSDVYSLGAILYYLLTARPPFSGHTIPETLAAVLKLPPTPPRTLNAEVPRDLGTICLKCLEKQPARRYATARELADDLGRFLNDEPILARPVGFVERSWRWCRRNTEMASLGLSLIIVLASIGVVVGILHARGNRAADTIRPPQAATRPSYMYTGAAPDLMAADEDTLDLKHIGTGMSVAVDPKNNHLWCPILISNAVVVRDGISGAVITNLTLADCPGAAAFDIKHRVVWITAQCGLSSNTNYPSDDLLWVISADAPYVPVASGVYCGGVNGGPEVVNPVTGRFYHDVKGTQRVDPGTFIPKQMPYGTPRAAHPTANLLYAVGKNTNSELQILDGASDPEAVLTTIDLPFPNNGIYVAVNPRLEKMVIAHAGSDKIVIADALTGKIEDTITVAAAGVKVKGVQGVAIDSVRNRIFAVVLGEDNKHYYLFAIQGSDQRVVAIPGFPGGPVVNPAINKVYVWTQYHTE